MRSRSRLCATALALLLVLTVSCSDEETASTAEDDSTAQDSTDDTDTSTDPQEESEISEEELRDAIEGQLAGYTIEDDELDCLVTQLMDLPADQLEIAADPETDLYDMGDEGREAAVAALDSCLSADGFAQQAASLFVEQLPGLDPEVEGCLVDQFSDFGGVGQMMLALGGAGDEIPDTFVDLAAECIPPRMAAGVTAEILLDEGTITPAQRQCVVDTFGEDLTVEMILTQSPDVDTLVEAALASC